MQRTLLPLLLAVAVTICPLTGTGWAHGNKKHDKAEAATKSQSLQEDTDQTEIIDGIRGDVHIVRLKGVIGDTPSYRLTVRFVVVETDELLQSGQAAVRYTADHDKVGRFDPLLLKDGVFVGDLRIYESGEQHFLLVFKPDEEKTLNFHFHFTF